MGLHRRRHHVKLRLPDYLALLLVAAVAVSATLWWRAQFQNLWLETGGRVVEGQVVESHYNAQLTEPRVDLLYTYTVGGVVFDSRWKGFWPVEHSPNALPESRYNELFTPGHPLTVFYEAGNPSNADLHRQSNESRLILTLVTVLLVAGTCVYLLRFYPAWRRG